MKHIVYVVTEDLETAEALLQSLVNQPGVVRVERTVYEYRTTYRDWDFSLVNDRFLIEMTGERGLGNKVKQRLLSAPTKVNASRNGDEDVVTVVGDLPHQSLIRLLLKGLPYQTIEVSAFVAAKKVKRAKSRTSQQS